MDAKDERTATWTARVADWRGSGQTATAFCRAHGLCTRSLRNWAARLDRLDAEAAAAKPAAAARPVRLARVVRLAASPRVEVASVPVLAPLAQRPSHPSGEVVVEIAGARVAVGPGFDSAVFAAVVAVLRGGAA